MLEPHEDSRLSVAQAMSLAYAELPTVNRWIVGAILKMRMPALDGIGVPAAMESAHADPRAPSASAVRRSLLGDEDLHGDIAEEVYVSLHRRLRRMSMGSGEIRPFLCVVTQRAARRHARRRALREMARTHFGPDGLDVDALGGNAPQTDDLLAERQELHRLEALVRRLPTVDLVLLEATATGHYRDAAAKLGITPKAARNRACLLRRRLRSELAP